MFIRASFAVWRLIRFAVLFGCWGIPFLVGHAERRSARCSRRNPIDALDSAFFAAR